MNNLQKVLLLSILALWVVPGFTFACNAKGGKDCSTSVANKTDHKVKLGKLSAPAANVGDRTVVGGVNSLGIPLSQYSSKPGYQLNGETLSEFDLIVLTQHQDLFNSDGSLTDKAISSGYTQILIPVLSMVEPGAAHPVFPVEYYLTHNGRTTQLTERQIGYLRQTGSINVDGTLKQASIDRGFSYVMHYPTPTPNAVQAPNVVVPAEMKTPGYAEPGKVPVAGEVLAPNVVAPVEMKTPGYAVPSKAPVAGQVVKPTMATFSAASTGGSHLVEVYQPVHSGIYRYEASQQLQHDEFHFVVVGFKLPE